VERRRGKNREVSEKVFEHDTQVYSGKKIAHGKIHGVHPNDLKLGLKFEQEEVCGWIALEPSQFGFGGRGVQTLGHHPHFVQIFQHFVEGFGRCRLVARYRIGQPLSVWHEKAADRACDSPMTSDVHRNRHCLTAASTYMRLICQRME
jgi:hypothetical protein